MQYIKASKLSHVPARIALNGIDDAVSQTKELAKLRPVVTNAATICEIPTVSLPDLIGYVLDEAGAVLLCTREPLLITQSFIVWVFYLRAHIILHKQDKFSARRYDILLLFNRDHATGALVGILVGAVNRKGTL